MWLAKSTLPVRQLQPWSLHNCHLSSWNPWKLEVNFDVSYTTDECSPLGLLYSLEHCIEQGTYGEWPHDAQGEASYHTPSFPPLLPELIMQGVSQARTWHGSFSLAPVQRASWVGHSTLIQKWKRSCRP